MDVFLIVVLTMHFQLTLGIANFSEIVQSTGTQNTMYSISDLNQQENVITLSNNCTVKPALDTIRHDIKEMLNAGTKLINFELNFRNLSGKLVGEDESDIYKPFLWERSSGPHGHGLLFLKRGFEILSLSTLLYGTENMNVELLEEPLGCLLRRNITEIESGLRWILLNDFQGISTDGTAGSLSDKEHICNMHIKNNSRRAEFYHICCTKNSKGRIDCQELVKDTWVQILFYCIYIMNILVIMFSPYLLPNAGFQDKNQRTKFEINCGKKILIKVKKVSDQSDANGDDAAHTFYVDELSSMPNFKDTLRKMKSGVVHNIYLSKIHVKHENLIPPNDVPLRIFQSFYDIVFLCKIGERHYLKDCCRSQICKLQKRKPIAWYHCLRKLMFLVSCILVFVPWIIRVAIFYWYEDKDHNDREDAAKIRKLEIYYTYFPGSLTSSLTPVHEVFLFCYIVLALDALLVGMLTFLAKNVTRYTESVFRKCLRDMHDLSYSKSFGWAGHVLLYPFKKYGILGFFIAVIYWLFILPVVLFVLGFHCIPILNIALRLLCHLVMIAFPKLHFPDIDFKILTLIKKLRNDFPEKETERSSRKDRLLQLIVIFLSFIALFSCLILAVEVIVFFVEMIVYSLIGIILNVSQCLKYVSLLFMLTLYAKDCFGRVTRKYQVFNQAINKTLLSRVKEDVDEEARLHSEKNVFKIKLNATDSEENETTIDPVLFISNSGLKWKIRSTLLLLDNQNTPYITSKFFFEAAYMDHSGCPGMLYTHMARAIRQFLVIFLFLFFVVVVVMAFGNEYSISGVNQMLATLAGGFLPWVFTNVFFRPPPEIEVDTSTVSFQTLLDGVICNHEEKWPVSDIECDEKYPETSDPIKSSSDKNRVLVIDHNGKETEGTLIVNILTKDRRVNN